MQMFIDYWAFFVNIGLLFAYVGFFCYLVARQRKKGDWH